MSENYYIKRVDLVIDYIEKNIDTKLSLEKLAEVAMFSKFHFHRIFKAIIGESLNTYIKRQKMTKAYKFLHTDKSLTVREASCMVGYKSLANFSRDFKSFYGVKPADIKQLIKEPNKTYLQINEDELNVKFIEVKTLKSKHLIYKRIRNGYNTTIIPQAFEELYKLALNRSFLIKQFIGVGYDDPDYTSADKCMYDACIEVDKKDIPNEMEFNHRKLEASKYAFFLFEGHKTKIHNAWDYVFKTWLLNSNYLPDDKPHLELYLPCEQMDKGYFNLYLCLPIK